MNAASTTAFSNSLPLMLCYHRCHLANTPYPHLAQTGFLLSEVQCNEQLSLSRAGEADRLARQQVLPIEAQVSQVAVGVYR